MFQKTLANGFSKFHGNGIAYHATNLTKRGWLTWCYELIGLWKTLKDGPLAEGNSAILVRVTEATISKAIELRCDGGGWIIPNHPAINAGVGFSRAFLMAVCH